MGIVFKKSEIINQIENSITSENPYSTLEIKDENLIIATPQKIIDNQIQTKYQIWFDVFKRRVDKKRHRAPVQRVGFSSGLDKPEYTIHDNIELSQQKTARILRKLNSLRGEKIYAYASLFDGSGLKTLAESKNI